jgi:hypothetical protein
VGITTLTGCAAIVILISALFLGLWLDGLLGRRGPLTVCLMALSAPLSVYIMVRIALILVKYIQPLELSDDHDDDEEVIR